MKIRCIFFKEISFYSLKRNLNIHFILIKILIYLEEAHDLQK